jgi:hypothetical protein
MMPHQFVNHDWHRIYHLQSEKEDTMLAREERTEQCMVSTIVDGIDNGQVEDVFLYRASYSLVRLVQTLGQIRSG